MVVTAAGLLALILCGLPAQDVDNPEYANWARFKVGARSTLRTVTDAGGVRMEQETVTRLAQLTPEKAVLEIATCAIVSGKKTDPVLQTKEVPAKAPAAAKPDAEGDEEVEAAGRKFRCHWVQTTRQEGDQKVSKKLWLSDEVPGRVVKSETERGAKATTILTEFTTE